MKDIEFLRKRLLSGDPNTTASILAEIENAGMLADLLSGTLLENKLDRWVKTGEHIDSMFEDDRVFTHFWGSDGRFELKIESFSYYDSALTGSETLEGTWTLAGLKPACYVIKLNGTVRESARGRAGEDIELFFVSTAEIAELLIAFPDWESPFNSWMKG